MKNILSPLYTASAEAYYKEIQSSNELSEFLIIHSSKDLNTSIEINDFISGNLTFKKNTNSVYLDFFGQPAISSSIVLEKSQQKRVRRLIPLLLETHKSLNVNLISFSNYLNPLEEIFMHYGLEPSINFYSTIDLNLDLASFKSSLRKSYKSLVNWGKNNLDIRIIDSNNLNEESFFAFKDLHIEASGRKTRSDVSWEKQLQAIKCNEAFAI